MAKLYTHANEAMQRILGTVITYDSKPHLVETIRERGVKLGLRYLRDVESHDSELFFVEQEDPKLKMYAPQLGYANTRDNSLYVMRCPARRWKQGVDTGSLVYVLPDGSMGRHVGLHLSHLADCFENIYPEFKEAMNMFGNKNPFAASANREVRTCVAFSKQFAISGSGKYLSFKGKRVGRVEEGVPVLEEKYLYLTESLEEVSS